MKLPNADRAIISEGKVMIYLLEESHPDNRGKARLLRALGYSREEWRRLESDLRAQHLTQEADDLGVDSYGGHRWQIVAPLDGPSGSARMKSIWLFEPGSAATYNSLSSRLMKRPKLHESAVLLRDLPDLGLRSGHIGVVVHVYESAAFYVEFLDTRGYTVALVLLPSDDVRAATQKDMTPSSWPDPLPSGMAAPIADATTAPPAIAR